MSSQSHSRLTATESMRVWVWDAKSGEQLRESIAIRIFLVRVIYSLGVRLTANGSRSR
jgi:hypothetical protein